MNSNSRILKSIQDCKDNSVEFVVKGYENAIIKSINKNAISHNLFEFAKHLAMKADQRRSRGRFKKLDGVTFTIKDNLWLKNFPASFGSSVYKDFVPSSSSLCVKKLLSLGAIPLAITSCSELCCTGITRNYKTGDTMHPYDDNLTPGGSSGGAATSCALGLGDFALVTDAGGSARRPAALTGLVGYKPSNGLITDINGFKDPSFLLSTVSVISEYSEDAKIVLDCLSYHNKLDYKSVLKKYRERKISTKNAIYSETLGSNYMIDSDISLLIMRALSILKENDWHITRDESPFGRSYETYPLLALQQAGLAAFYGNMDRNFFSEEINEQIEIGKTLSGAKIIELLYERQNIFTQVQSCLRKCDVLVCPTIATVAWNKSKLYPSIIGGKIAGPRSHAAFTPIFNYVGCPSISLPIGNTKSGLPVGLQFVTKYLDDVNLLKIAKDAEHLFKSLE